MEASTSRELLYLNRSFPDTALPFKYKTPSNEDTPRFFET